MKTPGMCNIRLIQCTVRIDLCNVVPEHAFVSLGATQRRLCEILEIETRVNPALGNAF